MAHIVFRVNGEVVADVTSDDMNDANEQVSQLLKAKFPGMDESQVEITAMTVDLALPVPEEPKADFDGFPEDYEVN